MKLFRIILVGAMLLSIGPGCFVNVEPDAKSPPRKGGVDVKVDRDQGRLDVDVDIKKPKEP